ncbi:uracil-DNA glycosylase [Lactobacillus sp. S2-2]|uniref:uracil-DNA glycosylase n=1 Tax=Lactobacillus sp. S2-2 TaxID=2692917 RepID=UPI001F01D07C|nr:uracil-DNA glycosylase [Lactobacillus sp. S2-2]
MLSLINNDWQRILKNEFEKDYFIKLKQFLNQETKEYVVYPKKQDIFRALNLTAFEDVKVVILGQDPYHEKNQANGLSFSVNQGVKLPPSLKNIFKELENDLNIKMSDNGDLKSWANQGVLLLNTVLTVRDGFANSHKNQGWEIFTDEIIRQLSNKDGTVIFVLWGKNAQDKIKLIDSNKNKIIKSSHPSPLSAYRGFLGSKPFTNINDELKNEGKSMIDWKI